MQSDEGLVTRIWLEELQATSSDNKEVFHSKKLSLDKSTHRLTQTFCKKNKIQWEVLLQSAFGLLLNRLSTTDYIVYGKSSSNGSHAKHLKCGKSIIPIKSIINDKLSVKNFIKQIKKQAAQKNSPNDQEIRYLLLFKTNKTKDDVMLDCKQFTAILFSNKATHLTLFYSPTHISSKNADNILQHLIVILQAMCENAQNKIVKLSILTAEEKKLLCSTWSCPQYHFKSSFPQSCTHELFSTVAKQNPNHLAVSYQHIQVSYKSLDIVATYLAQNLLKKGIKSGDRICVLMERTPTLIMALLAIFKIGATFVPINLKYPKERIEYILDDANAKIILTNQFDTLEKKYQHNAISISADWHSLDIKVESNAKPLPWIDPEETAYIIYTSGTTGKPKGVKIRHISLCNLTYWYQNYFSITEDDRTSQFASQGFDTFLCETIPYLATGASVHIVDDHIKLSPPQFFSWLEKEKITICDLPTAYAQILFNLSWPKHSFLRIVKIGGENFTRYPEQPFSFDIWNSYGPTEATIETTYAKIYTANTSHPLSKATPPIGRPLYQVETYVIDKYNEFSPVGVAGELLIGGISLSSGYLNQEDLSNEKFIPHLFKKNQKLYRTGDLVRWLPNGQLEFIGRIDHQIKIRGYRIELGDIEHAVSQLSDVSEVAVLSKEDINHEKSLIAYVVPNLERLRFLYQERCLLSIHSNQFIETITEDISKFGVALSSVTEPIEIGHLIQLYLKLPGFNESKLLSGHVIWYQDNRCGIAFDTNVETNEIIKKSIDYYLATHNVMELVMSAAAKRSFKKALRKKLPEYMIPSTFVTLLEFPLTFSGKIDTKALPPPQEMEKMLQKKLIEPQTETQKKLSALWCQLLKQKAVSMSDSFFDLGGNSLTAAELTVKILQTFNTSIPTKLLFDLPYIPILAEYIDTGGKTYTKQSHIQEDIERDVKLHEHILPTKQLSIWTKKPQNILLTGAGGFLGIFLLNELLANTDAKIHCIIRRGEFETAAKRLQDTIKKFNLSDEVSLSNRRIIAISGDISFDDFGLPSEQYNHLAHKIDLIYHCGAQVNTMTAYHKLRGSNVIGTLEIIKFATRFIDKPIHYISTLSAACKQDEKKCLVEDFPDEKYDDLFGGYAISKWISERLLTEIKNRGLPISIYRS